MKFIKCQWKFYKNDPNWVPPVIADRKKLLDTEKNPFYQHAEIQLFLAYKNNEIVGRIAAITNQLHNEIHKDKVGFFGFFECENDRETAGALFDAAAEWLKSKGKNIMRGPHNPSQNDEWAFLASGFDRPPVILMTYNPPYYLELAEYYGLKKAKDSYAYLLNQDDYLTDKLKRAQKIVRKKNKVTIRSVDFKHKEQFEKDVKTLKELYNQAWEPNWGFVKMTDAEFDFLAADLKQFAEPSLAFIAECDGVPVGFALSLPDINQCLIHNKNGSLIGAAWHLLTKKKKIDTQRIIVLGVIPEYQGRGIDAVMYWETGHRGLDIGIKYGEASWVLEDNTMMNRGLTTTMNADRYKTYRAYEMPI
jgi:GNAT superfamily N-acetyltransferase